MMHQSRVGYTFQKLSISVCTCLFVSFTAGFSGAFSSEAPISIVAQQSIWYIRSVVKGDSSSTRKVGKSFAYPKILNRQIETFSLLKHSKNRMARKLEMPVNRCWYYPQTMMCPSTSFRRDITSLGSNAQTSFGSSQGGLTQLSYVV